MINQTSQKLAVFAGLSLILFSFLYGAEGADGVVHKNLVVNGNFAQGMSGWKGAQGVAVVNEEDKPFLRIGNGNIKTEQAAAIPDGTWKIRLSYRIRAKDVEKGEQDWQAARIGVVFTDKSAKQVGGWPQSHNVHGTADWTTYTKIYYPPNEATNIVLIPGNFGKSGIVDFADISVSVCDPVTNMLENSDFSHGLEFWQINPDVSIQADNGKKLLAVKSTGADSWATASQKIGSRSSL